MNRRQGRRSGVDACSAARERLVPYVLMALDQEERKLVTSHVDGCSACREALEFVEARLQAIGAAAPRPLLPPKRLRRPLRRRLVPWLALIPAVAAFGMLLLEGVRIARYRYEQRFMSRLERALFLYRLDHGRFPASDEPLAAALSQAEGGPYLDLSRERVDVQGHFLDYWGQRYRYSMPGTHNPRLFDLHSPGQNGRDDGGRGDDLANWELDWQRLPVKGER